MPRTRNEEAYAAARTSLLDVGLQLIRSRSFASVGINDILRAGDVPKGSFYHYFESKRDFGLAVARFYHHGQMEAAARVLRDPELEPFERLRSFFDSARQDFARREFGDGCLMCNLTNELGDVDQQFQVLLASQWRELADELSTCVAQCEPARLGLAHLSSDEAADWLLNAWSGALSRMKAERSDAPLSLFMKSMFERGSHEN